MRKKINFKTLLESCTTRQSTATKTGVFYVLGDVIILEYMKSTKNIWVDDEISELLTEKEKTKSKLEICEFFRDDVKSVYFDLPLNRSIKEFNEKIANIFNQYMNHE